MANFFKKALPYLAGAAGQTVSAVVPGLNKYGAALSAGAGALANKNNRAQGALQGFTGGGASATLGGGIYGSMGKQGYGANFGSGAMEGLKQFGGTIPGFGGIGTSNPTGVMAKFLTPQSIQGAGKTTLPNASTGINLKPTGNKMSYAAAPQTSAFKMPSFNTSTTAPTTDVASSLGGGIKTKGLMEKFDLPQMAAGAGVSMLGDAFTKDVPASDFSPVLNPLRERINTPSPTNQAALDTYMKTVKAPIGANAADARAVSALRSQRQKEQDLKALQQQFQAAAPGMDVSNNSAYINAVNKYNTDFAASEEAQNAQIQFEYDNMQRSQQMAAAAALADMDQAQIQSLANLAQYDIYTIAEQTGYDLQKAQAVKDLAAKAGELIMSNAMGVTNG